MLSINTNLSSLIAQNSLTTSTDLLNQAIERMSTGCKINHAGDNAANYSISTNMSTKLSSFEVAQDNVAAGMDLVSVASDNLSLISDHASRIRDLCMQAQNGTYGAQSINAIKSEASARIAEIVRLYNTAEYNGINLLNKLGAENLAVIESAGISTGEVVGLEHDITPKKTGFIDDIVTVTPDVVVTDPTLLATAIANNDTIGIGNAETLAKLAELVNSGTTCDSKTITLTEDIDLSAYSTGEGWTPIGTGSKYFKGTFDGQGHKITNLYINRPTSDYQGLFGQASGELKNIGIENCNVTGNGDYVGGLVGYAEATITNSYATGTVTGNEYVGGLAGVAWSDITNSYATGNVTGNGDYVGGLAGEAYEITNSYATGNVTGGGFVGGLVGDGSCENCYATGNVTGYGDYVGGLAGYAAIDITNCYATGNVTGNDIVGGLAGLGDCDISNSYATGDVTGQGIVGGLVGDAEWLIINSFSTGNVAGNYTVGGLVGETAGDITNSYTTGNVTGNECVGGLAGDVVEGTITNSISYSESVTGTTYVGSFCGYGTPSDITNCKTTEIEGLNKVGSTTDDVAGITYLPKTSTTLQVGINGDDSCQITFNTDFSFGLINSLKNLDVTDSSSLDFIDSFLNKVSEKQTELGAVQNRLDSAAESISVSIENLTKSRSTLRDADIAKESSEYIKAQILQEASATLLSTANQSPAIALQLI